MSAIASPDNRALYTRLRRWFGRHARTLPWRGETDPYRIWVSEILLVQTTATVAMKRYLRFLQRFPTLASLSRAPLGNVMKEWEGLGYYHRARHLHRAARLIQTEHGGLFPSTDTAIRALPGVGDYVAAAIMNFCFGRRIPPIDANVARVAARLFAIRGDVRSGAVRTAIRRRLERLMTIGRGALWTDALIEVGALVCLPRHPRCGECPLRADCRARHVGDPTGYGLPPGRPLRRHVNVACGIIRRADGRILIAQRPEDGLLPGLWEFPGGKRQGNESLAETCRREIREELGITVAVGVKRMVIPHAYSHYNVRLHVFECRYLSGIPRPLGCQRFRWVRLGELARLAFPAANRQIIEAIMAG
ncbi:MAG: A/G-specific adenine glycosylase [Candidatus Zixiibacteriota bacterium]